MYGLEVEVHTKVPTNKSIQIPPTIEIGEDIAPRFNSENDVRSNPSSFGIEAYHFDSQSYSMGFLETREREDEADNIATPERNNLLVTDGSRREQLVATFAGRGVVAPIHNKRRNNK